MSEQTVVDIEPAFERRTKRRAAPYKARLEDLAGADLIVLGTVIADRAVWIYERRYRRKLLLIAFIIVLGIAAVIIGLARTIQLMS